MHIEKFHDKAVGTPTKNAVTNNPEKKIFGLLQSKVTPCLLSNETQVKICFVQLKGFKCPNCLYFASSKNLLSEHTNEHDEDEVENKNIESEKAENNNIASAEKQRNSKLRKVAKIAEKVAKTSKTPKASKTSKRGSK